MTRKDCSRLATFTAFFSAFGRRISDSVSQVDLLKCPDAYTTEVMQERARARGNLQNAHGYERPPITDCLTTWQTANLGQYMEVKAMIGQTGLHHETVDNMRSVLRPGCRIIDRR